MDEPIARGIRMAYCRKCGEVIDDEAVFCPKCGVQQAMAEVKKEPDDDGSLLWALIAFLLPFVGIILWAAWMNDKPKSSKMAGWGTFVSLAVCAVVIFIVFFSFGPRNFQFSFP